jgi:multidrug efflux system membrane fusion protein
MKRRTIIVTALCAAIALGAGAVLVGAQNQGGRDAGRGQGTGGPPPIPVLADVARTADVPVYLEGVGTVQAYNTVTVRAQVDGRLIAVEFREGQEVRRGDVLARIDPTTYQAQFDQAQARLAQNTALLANARLDLVRYTRLAQTDYATRQQADTQRATVAQLEAQVRADQAAVDNARAILAYTTISAPIDGRVGIRQVDVGNIIQASNATGLVVIAQMRPISVVFALPQQHLRAINAAFANGRPMVLVTGEDERTPLDRGELEVIDNQVDQTTGTIRMKATFPNEQVQLWPGQFVNVQLLVRTLRDVVVVPTAAVQRGPDGPYVYVIADDRAVLRRVGVGDQTDLQSVITSNLEAGERVVTTGFARLTNGARVSVSAPEDASNAEQAPRPANRPTGRRRQGGAP